MPSGPTVLNRRRFSQTLTLRDIIKILRGVATSLLRLARNQVRYENIHHFLRNQRSRMRDLITSNPLFVPELDFLSTKVFQIMNPKVLVC